ncbi:hypothetical protein TEK04_10195 [Klenkia sp. LSe6-5]|uniref:LysM domain-containing protein n=1 Tax=Klenkia sesuvii TaxID=3103137 RepID=A0ABU8DTA8_9ACTN
MTVRRWVVTTLVMAAVGWVLRALAPGGPALQAALTDPQHVVDTVGADALLLPVAWAAAVLCWSWGVVGLALTRLSARTGVTGRLAGALLHVVLPAGLRQVAAVAVGVSLAATPVAAWAAPAQHGAVPTTSVQKVGPADAAWSDVGAPDGGNGEVPVVPDWPGAPGWDEHVVVRGDCLWDIAAAWLADRTDGPVGAAATAQAVQAWWSANVDVVGPDPDLLLPGQVLRAPALP